MSTDATTTDGFRVGRRVRLRREGTEGVLVESLPKDVMDRRNWWTVRISERDWTHHEGNLELLPEDAPATPEPAPADDPVNRPAHYTQGGIECIDAIKAALTPEEFKGYLKGNVFKYGWRERHKGGVESLRKARWHLDKLIVESEIN